jgi:hypothetical protein
MKKPLAKKSQKPAKPITAGELKSVEGGDDHLPCNEMSFSGN